MKVLRICCHHGTYLGKYDAKFLSYLRLRQWMNMIELRMASMAFQSSGQFWYFGWKCVRSDSCWTFKIQNIDKGRTARKWKGDMLETVWNIQEMVWNGGKMARRDPVSPVIKEVVIKTVVNKGAMALWKLSNGGGWKWIKMDSGLWVLKIDGPIDGVP